MARTRQLDREEFELWSASLELAGVEETERNFFLYYLGEGVQKDQIKVWFDALIEASG